ncbi:uncharacterized protein BDV17DRAFT_259905 [Aspergillus undulatus]|uniref:uncharacterized protein n=1 Tax=Aspergillus undulatus TaxID=1810928 RepID=UPI003CCD9534
MDPEEAPPPPYSAVDPLLAPSASNRNAPSSSAANPGLLHLRGGDARLHGRAGAAAAAAHVAASVALPAHFSSAAAYFAERPPPEVQHGEQALEHHMTIYPRSQAKDFPRRPRCWSPRMDNIAQQDWDMFLRHLFPSHLGLASSSAELPRQVRAEIRRDRKDRPQETDEERERRIATVMKEWNQYFFEPRAVRILFFYVTDPRAAPISPLCPRCYPAATRASGNRTGQTPEAGRGHPLPPNIYPAAGYNQPMFPGQAPAPYGYPNPGMPAPFPPQQGSGFFHPANPHQYQNPYPQYPAWGWGNQYPQQQESSSLKGGPLSWFSNLAAKAQVYGDRLSEQAWQYGDQITAHASHYGRQVEEQALAHGRWIEEQAGLGSRKVESGFSGWNPPQQPYYPYQYPQPPASHTPNPTQQNAQQTGVTTTTMPIQQATATATQQQQQREQPTSQPRQLSHNQTQTQAQTHPQSQSQTQSQPQSRTPLPLNRRPSTSSTTSDSSLSSISSISTTSDLSSSDLATVRAQLLSLDAHHDRDLYDAAVELRRQLDALRESKRQARVNCSNRTTTSTMANRLRSGWGSSSRASESSHGFGSGRNGSSWGRWESPADRQRNAAERRAAKEELRATRKAFRDVLKRAREEQRERRRVKRGRRRQERRAREREREAREGQSQAAPTAESSSLELQQRLQNLELESSRGRGRDGENAPEQVAGPRSSTQRASPGGHDDAASESSAVSSIRTPSASSDDEGDAQKKEKEKKADKEIK